MIFHRFFVRLPENTSPFWGTPVPPFSKPSPSPGQGASLVEANCFRLVENFSIISLYNFPSVSLLFPYYLTALKPEIGFLAPTRSHQTRGHIRDVFHDANLQILQWGSPKSCWLVVDLPLWKIWVRQLGWWHSQYVESHSKFHGSSHPQPDILLFQLLTID